MRKYNLQLFLFLYIFFFLMTVLVSGSVSQKEFTHEAFLLNEKIFQAEKEDFSQENKGILQTRDPIPFRDEGVPTRRTLLFGKDAVLVSKRVSKTREDISFRKNVPHKTSPPEVIQKLPETPMEIPIRVKAHTGYEYCYAPTFVDGESYIYLDTCSASDVRPARYDVFQRVAWNVKNVWLCMTAPGSVTRVDGSGKAQWDYVKLRPCVTNDPNQRWIIKEHAFYTADGKYRVKDLKWYAYISKNAKDYYNHTLMPSMDSWASRVVAPGSISLHISVGWKYVTSTGFDTYYLSDNGSKSNMVSLYYNPENGHIARYFPSAGILSCMTSKQSSKDNWDWVVWKLCKDTVSSTKDAGYWDLSYLNGREGALRDKNGNFLRVTKYGVNWGMPYTAKGEYLKSDTKNSPTSEFVLSYDIQKWNRYVDGNLGDSLRYCPAPGHKNKVANIQFRTKKKLLLPPNFPLSEAWLRRLHDIATTTDGIPESAGVCGVCLLQTYQMIGELQEYYPRNPLPRGGYFFDTAPSTNPFTSLRRRYPMLHTMIQDAPRTYGFPLTPGETYDRIAFRVASSTTQIVLPRFNWRASSLLMTQSEIRNAIQTLLNANPGTVWVGLVTYAHQRGGVARHAVPIIRGTSGLIVIPTNMNMEFTRFTELASETTNIDEILLRLTNGRRLNVVGLGTLQLIDEDEDSLSLVMSQNNCTGDGNDRRGNRQPPRSSLINQCLSGRCAIL
ncbi:DUF1561 family protein [Bartonella sp. F02]|uniref:DUF1561 family protein n=1 Tax=Bartonella sp. F02 TaxID=2967262 RepID=UPI0022A9732C|nr:DUF1561 family protein [Bartonella sp. F02]MCZ2329020.1 DUF1561 domain-containing protein [Bartonella sp. F02]